MAQRVNEEELKYLLAGHEDLERLLGAGGLGGYLGTERQENLYFDTRNLRLLRGLAMLRARAVAGGKVSLTLKSGTELEAGYFSSEEVEADITGAILAELRRDPASMFRHDLAPVRALRARFGEPKLVLIGTLRNERARFLAQRFLVEVDRMTFPDGTEEYEVELETEERGAAREWLLGEFRRLGVRAEPGRETKLERLLRRHQSPP